MLRHLAIATAWLVLASCGKGAASPTEGVDRARKVIYLGALNAESGPAAPIGKPFADGKRLAVALANRPDSGLLPDGWKVELIERDHAYNPQRAVQSYREIKDDVLFIMTSFGTPATVPLRDLLTEDRLFAFPASLSSKMAEHEFTPPVAPSYVVEALRAVEWARQRGATRLAVVYQNDDFGLDGLAGVRQGIERYGGELADSRTVFAGQKDVTAVVASLKEVGAEAVFLAVLPSTTAALLGTAHQLDLRTTWLGSTPAWSEALLTTVPADVLEGFYWVTGFPYWGEDLPGMAAFKKAHAELGAGLSDADFYVLSSYIAGRIQLEALSRAIRAGDLSREGFRRAFHSLTGYTADGLLQPVDFSTVPYRVSRRVRVLEPSGTTRTWKVASDYAEPGGGS